MTCKVRNLLAVVWNAPQAISNNSVTFSSFYVYYQWTIFVINNILCFVLIFVIFVIFVDNDYVYLTWV